MYQLTAEKVQEELYSIFEECDVSPSDSAIASINNDSKVKNLIDRVYEDLVICGMDTSDDTILEIILGHYAALSKGWTGIRIAAYRAIKTYVAKHNLDVEVPESLKFSPEYKSSAEKPKVSKEPPKQTVPSRVSEEESEQTEPPREVSEEESEEKMPAKKGGYVVAVGSKRDNPRPPSKLGTDDFKVWSDGWIQIPEYGIVRELLGLGLQPYLYGPTGCGKSDVAERVAIEMNLDIYVLTSPQSKSEIVGYPSATGEYVPSGAAKAYIEGKYLVIEEIDASDPIVGVCANNLTSGAVMNFPVVNTVHRHPEFRCLATGNTVGRGATAEYSGRNPQDLSTLNRLIVVTFRYYRQVDLAIAKGDEDMADYMTAFRKAAKMNKFLIPVSYRNVKEFSTVYAVFPRDGINSPFNMVLFKSGFTHSECTRMYDTMSKLLSPSNRYLKDMASWLESVREELD